MNKKSVSKTVIAKLVADRIETQSIKSITEVLNTTIELFTELLADNKSISIQNFLTIENKLVKGRVGNFNNIAYKTEDRFVPKVKLSQNFKEAVQNESR